MNKGKIIRIISNLYSVLVNDTIIEARARGKFRKDEISPMVGDEVIIDIEKKYIIENKKPPIYFMVVLIISDYFTFLNTLSLTSSFLNI